MSAPISPAPDQPSRHHLGDDDDQQRTCRMAGFAKPAEVADVAEEARVLNHDADVLVDARDQILVTLDIGLGDRALKPSSGSRLYDAAIVRMQPARDQPLVPPRHAVAISTASAARSSRRTSRRLPPHPVSSVTGSGLEEILQRALRDLRLVGRVGGQNFAALDHVVDGRRT